ncbi:MAG TPA: hypothetical protein VF133_12770 [Terriglobales bacterium]
MMPDDFEEKTKEPIDWQYYRGLLRRHTLRFLVPFFLGWAVVWGISWVMPSVYRSGTLILVEQPTVPSEFVVPNVAGDLQSRLQSISQQILSRTRLLRIIEQQNLYPEARQRLSQDELVERMRKDIEIELNRTRDGRALTSFNVYYSARTPAVAQSVTNELSRLFINENLEVRQQQSQATTDFLQAQLEGARQELAKQEQKLKDFKGSHLGGLPGQLQTNLQVLAGLQSQLRGEQDALNRARQQTAYLQSLLNQYQAVQVATKTTENGAPLSLPAIDQELSRLSSQLTDLLAHYTEKHPDVRKLKNQMAETQRLKAQLQAGLNRPKSPTSQNAATSVAELSDKSPVFQLESQLAANNLEISNHQNTIKQLEAQISVYQARLNLEPVLEQQLADVSRGYDQSKADYDSLLKKKNESELATNLELQQQGEHFRVLDPPNLPVKPYSPQRLRLYAMGLVLGVLLGGGFCGVKQATDDRIFSEREFKKLMPARVLAEIPPVLTDGEKRAQSRSGRLRWVGAGTVLTSLLLALMFTYLRG